MDDGPATNELLTALLDAPQPEAVARLRAVGNPDDVLADLADEAGRWMIADLDRSLDATARLVDLGDEVGTVRARACTRRARAQALASANRHEEALELASESVALATEGGHPVDAARARMSMMQVLDRLGRSRESLEVGEAARAAFREAGEDVLAARAEANIGVAYRVRAEALLELNRFSEAEAAFRSALDVFVDRGVDRAAAIVEGNLADLLSRQGRLRKALEHFELARRHLEADAAAPGDLARLSCEQAEAFAQAGLLHEAHEGYCAAIPELDRHQLAWEAARARTGLGLTLQRLGRCDEAAAVLDEAGAAFEALDHATARARVLLAQGELAIVRGNLPAARVSLTTALHLLADRPADAARARHHLAGIAITEGALGEAETLVGAALETVQELNLPPLLADLLHARARLRLAQGHQELALTDLHAAVEQVERLRGSLQAERARAAFFGQRTDVYEDLVAALIRASGNRVDDVFRVVEQAKSRALLDLVAGVLDVDAIAPDRAADPGARALLAELVNAKSEINALYSRVQDIATSARRGFARWREQMVAAEGRLRTLESRLASTRGVADVLAPPIDADAARAMLSPSTAIVEYFLTHGDLIALVVRSDGLHLFAPIAAIDDVEEIVEEVQFQLDRATGWAAADPAATAGLVDDIQRDLRDLHAIVLEPLASALRGVSRMIVVPHGALHAVPFHALHTGDGYLIEQMEVTSAPSASVLAHFAEPTPGDGASGGRSLVVGVADDVAPQILDEVEDVAARLDADCVLRGEEATRARLFEEASGVSILHLACHARFAPETPLASGVLLADGWLTVRDICELDLKGATVVLSGCATGRNVVDRGDELAGLVRGFAAAGAGSLLTTLWALHDESARELVSGVYGHWCMLQGSEKRSLAAAVRSAQCDLMKRHPHPVFWAPFVLVGPP